ncbi:MAG: hypothetical protein PHG91_13855 [Syntrophales bacterium]|nr:hypothetical protein [Syntrophales bacterium]MDD5533206.1 hypothetical protein [Syntrophales bacterium]
MEYGKEDPIVMISSYPPRLCGIGTFCEEAREFIQKRHSGREVVVISHLDGAGEGVFPVIDMKQRGWWRPVTQKISELHPYVVHIQHEYGLYEYYDERGLGDMNEGFLDLLDALADWPLVVEPHTIHGRMRDAEANFVYEMSQRTDILIFKCHYQKWRLDWIFSGRGWKTPLNIMVIPHGSRSDKRWGVQEIPALRAEIGLDKIAHIGRHVVGLVGWIQSNKRWDILTCMWEGIAAEIEKKTGEHWDLLAAGTFRDPDHLPDYLKYRQEIEILEKKGLAHYFEFIPRGDLYYKIMGMCDFIVLPSTDETQSGTLARIIALNKPFITTAPMEGLTAQTLESEGGLLFTTKEMLRSKVIRLACDEKLRFELGQKLKDYLENVVSWDIVSRQYDEAYETARDAKRTGIKAVFPLEF